jgi:3'-phosphoadenosine 5'-phosphosulfate (PAPS) 3'-phosphatase
VQDCTLPPRPWGGRFDVHPCGAVYKLGLVGAGRADATRTLVRKSEWHVVGGTTLVRGAGGLACLRDGSELAFNQERPLFPNYMAAGRALGEAAVRGWLK